MNIKFTNTILLTTIALSLTLTSGCGKNVEDDWLKAKAVDTAQSYEQYLTQRPNSPREAEARKALSEIVFIPYLAFAGSRSDMPPLDQLKVPEKVMSSSTSEIFNSTSFKMSGNMSSLMLNGHIIQLANSGYDNKEIDTIKFGKLRCALAYGNMGKTSYCMIFYLGGTRAQRDAVITYVRDPAK